MERTVALITGANAGIGLAVAERLLLRDPDTRLVLACRSAPRAEAARKALLVTCPKADICIILVNVSSIESVYKAAKEIRKRYSRLDYLYLNAGIMPVSSINWSNFWSGLFSNMALWLEQYVLNQFVDYSVHVLENKKLQALLVDGASIFHGEPGDSFNRGLLGYDPRRRLMFILGSFKGQLPMTE